MTPCLFMCLPVSTARARHPVLLRPQENPPENPQFDKMQRNILASSPRVTRFKIEWGDVKPTKPHIDLAVHNQMPPRQEEEDTFDLPAKLPAPPSPKKVEPAEDFMDFSL